MSYGKMIEDLSATEKEAVLQQRDQQLPKLQLNHQSLISMKARGSKPCLEQARLQGLHEANKVLNEIYDRQAELVEMAYKDTPFMQKIRKTLKSKNIRQLIETASVDLFKYRNILCDLEPVIAAFGLKPSRKRKSTPATLGAAAEGYDEDRNSATKRSKLNAELDTGIFQGGVVMAEDGTEIKQEEEPDQAASLLYWSKSGNPSQRISPDGMGIHTTASTIDSATDETFLGQVQKRFLNNEDGFATKLLNLLIDNQHLTKLDEQDRLAAALNDDVLGKEFVGRIKARPEVWNRFLVRIYDSPNALYAKKGLTAKKMVPTTTPEGTLTASNQPSFDAVEAKDSSTEHLAAPVVDTSALPRTNAEHSTAPVITVVAPIEHPVDVAGTKHPSDKPNVDKPPTLDDTAGAVANIQAVQVSTAADNSGDHPMHHVGPFVENSAVAGTEETQVPSAEDTELELPPNFAAADDKADCI